MTCPVTVLKLKSTIIRSNGAYNKEEEKNKSTLEEEPSVLSKDEKDD